MMSDEVFNACVHTYFIWFYLAFLSCFVSSIFKYWKMQNMQPREVLGGRFISWIKTNRIAFELL